RFDEKRRIVARRVSCQSDVVFRSGDDARDRWMIGAASENQMQAVESAESHGGNEHVGWIPPEFQDGFVKGDDGRHVVAGNRQRVDPLATSPIAWFDHQTPN